MAAAGHFVRSVLSTSATKAAVARRAYHVARTAHPLATGADALAVDLRSDTVTVPSARMRAIMAAAAVGDDVYGDDPSVNALEKHAAGMLGHEAALFVPTGTMANLLALGSHCARGEEVICGDQAHIYNYEAGGMSVLMSIPMHPIPNLSDGTLDLAAVEAAVRGMDSHFAPSKVLALEQTQNLCGGKVLPLSYLHAARAVATKHNLKFHIDGARLFNAAVALGVDARVMAHPCDSVSICLSKGLGAPLGSILVGADEFIYRARRLRKMVGGGMRQAGIVAAAGHLALEENVARLAEDHANARFFASEIARIPGVKLSAQTAPPASNVVYFSVEGIAAEKLIARAGLQQVKLGYGRKGEIRVLTHLDAPREKLVRAIEVLQSAIKALQ